MKFFGYENTICKYISDNGFDCELLHSEPNCSYFDYLMKKLDKNFFLRSLITI